MRPNIRSLMMITATALGLGIGWVLPAQQASGPQWKDRAEYDIGFTEYGQAKDSKGRLAVLDKWSKAYPDSELWEERDNAYLGVYGEAKNFRGAFDKAKQMRAKKPESYFAITSILTYIAQLNPKTDADYATAVETADYVLNSEDKVFAATNKPGNYKEDQWAKEKPAVQLAARQTKVYVLSQQKKYPELESLLTEYLKADPTQAAFSYTMATTLYAQRTQNQEKVPLAIFHFTRAGVYTGPNQLQAAQQKTANDTAQAAYKAWHGSMTDYDKVVALAKNNALPPADFKIDNINQINQGKFQQQQDWDKAHPELTWWRDNVQVPLVTGAAPFTQYEGVLLPPGPPTSPFTMFTAKIVSMTPESNPKEIVVEASDPADPNETKATFNAKLLLDPAPPGTMPVGSEIKFKGIVKAFQASPLLITFDVDTEEKELEGWTGTGPANAKQNKGKTSAPKSNTKQKGKGK